jgi:hypothetical protein
VNHGRSRTSHVDRDLQRSRSQGARRRTPKQWVGYRSAPFSRLQSAQRSWRFSIVVAPPMATGITWSY